jgi:hypothetical protein
MSQPDLNEVKTDIYITCPHCGHLVAIEKLNCCIFRHGIFKHNAQQIPPHSSKDECEKFINEKLIYGCGKPFKIIKGSNNDFTAIICDYI